MSNRPAWAARVTDPEVEALRAEARTAMAAPMARAGERVIEDDALWAPVELAIHRCLWLALERHYARLGAPMPSPSALPDDLAARDAPGGVLLRRLLRAPDTRARYVFLEDFLGHLYGTVGG